MKRIPVVTSFLLRRDGGRDRLLLLRRSSLVGSFQGMWGGVAGYMERDPDAQSLLEIEQETGLASADVRLLARGATVDAEDPDGDRVWVVHPYLYLALLPDKVRLDWEHTESRWVSPDDFRDYDKVPRLWEALNAVYPPLSPALEAGTEAVRNDRTHGASQLAGQAATVLETVASGFVAADRQEFLRELRLAALAIGRARPAMAPIGNVAALLYDAVAKSAEEDVEALRALTKDQARKLAAQLDENTARIAEHAALVLHRSVLINSYSSTVIRAIVANKSRLEHVVVAESRPGLEGRTTAKELAAHGIDVIVVTDAEAAVSLGAVEALIIGADAVKNLGDVVNKMGTYGLAVAARHQRTPVYALADTFKLMPARLSLWEEGREAEVWADPPSGVRVFNTVHDTTPSPLIKGYVTEDGLVTRRWVTARMTRIRAARELVGLVPGEGWI